MQRMGWDVRASVTAKVRHLNSCENKQWSLYCDLTEMKGPADRQGEEF